MAKQIITLGIGPTDSLTAFITTDLAIGSVSLPAVSTIQWSVGVDLDNDGGVGGDGEELIGYVQDAQWQLGFGQPYEAIARAATLTLMLNNKDKRFSPENSSSPLYPNFTRGKALQVQSNWNGTITIHYVGWIDSIEPLPGQKKERTVTVQCNGFLILAQDSEVFIEVQQNKRADEVIETILNYANIFPPGYSGYWRLGVSGASELGLTTTLGGLIESLVLDAEQGSSIFNVIADQWSDGVSVYGALRDVTGREGGRLFVSRSGTVTFWNRHHLLLETDSVATFDDAMVAMDYSYGDDVINHVIVKARPRSIGGSAEPLGQIDQAVRIKANGEKIISFRYADQDSGAKIAGKNALAPVQNTDFTANSDEDGSGADLTANVTAAITEESATRSRVTFTNSGSVDAWLQSGAQIRGIKITDYGETDVEAEDDTSIGSYRRHRYTYPFTMDDVDVAQGMANYVLSQRKDPVGRVKNITIMAYSSPENLQQVINRNIGDRITVTETQTGTSNDYFIIGEQWHLMKKNLMVTWMLELAANQNYWILGISGYTELGQTTRLAPF